MRLTDLIGSELSVSVTDAIQNSEPPLASLFPRQTGPVYLIGERLLGSGYLDRERNERAPTGDLPMVREACIGQLMFYEAESGERLVVFEPSKDHFVGKRFSQGYVRRFGKNDFSVNFFDGQLRSVGASLRIEEPDPSTSWGATFASQGIPGIIHWEADFRGDGGYERIALSGDSFARLRQMLDAWIPAKS